MALVDVVQCLQALDVSSLGLSGGEKKVKLRGEIGLVKEEKRVEEEKVVQKKETPTPTPTPADKARTNTENAKKAAEVRRKVLEAKQKKMENEAGKGKGKGGGEAGKK